MKIHCLSIVSPEYDKIYKVHKDSLDQYLPECKQVVYRPTDFKSNYTDIGQHICSIRPKVILEEFKTSNPDYIIFMGADVVFYKKPEQLLWRMNELEIESITITPHIVTPLPEDGKFPSNTSLSKGGHLNRDFVIWPNNSESIEFLEWQAKIMEDKCIATDQIFLDQTWLNFLPFIAGNVCIFKDPSYNVAYWNLHERDLNDITFFQFSGFDPNNIEGISKHQNRYKAEGKLLELLTDYAEKIK